MQGPADLPVQAALAGGGVRYPGEPGREDSCAEGGARDLRPVGLTLVSVGQPRPPGSRRVGEPSRHRRCSIPR
jgi:hypothetical protein